MGIVQTLSAIERRPGYDKINNPQRLSVGELLPIGISWISGGAVKTIMNSAGIDGIALRDLSGVAIIEAPYDHASNAGYIANADGSIRSRITVANDLESVMFYDVFYFNEILCFLASTARGDFRVEVDDSSGLVLRLVESR
ncbi:hypothetical protein [Cupriavidus sp. BIC8F]|uniref:hypothetical protein n=1 Tax=Cupriavidus sp. BIC8F TaxID=3079014 RepID=UPI00291645CD|nr:hypothetical protein [Cupriavidus sp. BIC8F]